MSIIMTDPLYKRMWIRRRFWKRMIFLIITFAISFYIPVFIFGNLKIPKVVRLTDLNRCPVCYGISICPELYSNQIVLEERPWQDLLFNVKNIYHGYTKSNRKVILKKLAYDKQLDKFDNNLCKTFNLHSNCTPMDLLNATNINKKIMDIVHYNLTRNVSLQPRTGLIFCPYPEGIHDFLNPILNNKIGKQYNSDLLNVWTMLNLNAEPIILQILLKSRGWAVPAYAGVCGRLEVVADEGVPLSDLGNIAWYRKLKIAKQILEMAMDFTFKHDRSGVFVVQLLFLISITNALATYFGIRATYRFYFFDWSADNIVVNEKDQVSYVDLEDVIILDKYITPKRDLHNWYQRYIKDYDENSVGYMFSIDLICRHHLSDHNIYSACYVLNGDDKPFLKPVPEQFEKGPFSKLVNQCLYGPDRFKAAILLQRYITDLLSKESVSGFGAVR